MKQAVIIGISGGFGSHVANALLADGWQVSGLLRDPSRCPAFLRDRIEISSGDASDIERVRVAAQGCELLVYAANPPYDQWQSQAVAMLEPSVRVAEELGLRLLFPGNVYGFDPADGPLFDESMPQRPTTGKGAIRLQMEQRLAKAAEQGARVLILRAGDFIGAHAGSTWLRQLLKAGKRGYRLQAPGPAGLAHSWAYLPDLAATAVKLLDREEELADFEQFHFAGYRASFAEIAAAVSEASGLPCRLGRFPWPILRLISPFSGMIRSLLEMRYLWQVRLDLNGGKLGRFLGVVPSTPLTVALRESGYLNDPL